MVTNNTYEYGIKYKIIKVENNEFFMKPVGMVGGLSDKNTFSTNYGLFPILVDGLDLKNKLVIDNIYETEDLEKIYDFYDDTDFLAKVFLDDYKDIFYYLYVDSNNKITKYEVKKSNFKNNNKEMIYEMDNGKPSILLNQDILKELLECDNIKDIKLFLNKYKLLLNKFNKYNKDKGITRIHFKDGEITSFDTDKKIDIKNQVNSSERVFKYNKKDVSYDGLRKAIKEKIIGHDEEIDTIAQKLYMNYTAEENDTIESILIVGPTGTGKTETVKAACEYLSIPYVITNTSNLVPQGIKGISIEKVLRSLYDKAGEDLLLAQRGLVFLDEFDKINSNDLSIKEPIKDILLSFTDGASIHVSDDYCDFEFNSKMTNKVYAGVFDEITKKEKKVGFDSIKNNTLLTDQEEIRNKIIEKKYFTLEELSRINTIVMYNDLTKEDKKMILLTSKLSEYANKKERYKRQFGIDIVLDEEYINAILDKISSVATGMRSVNNIFKKSIDTAEKAILEGENKGYKKLILTKDTVLDSKKFDII